MDGHIVLILGRNVRNGDGEGPGRGRGGVGGFSCCHGNGGAGGSFGSGGGVGDPDFNRNSGYRRTQPGPTYNFKGAYYTPFEVMGSGGGAGGPGHPGRSHCEGFYGSPGGGTMMIMARAFSNNGELRATGQQGGPWGRHCRWPHDNPQSGSGGGGSGGGIKVMTASNSPIGRWSARGGSRPILQRWGNSGNQRGGAGGNGRSVHQTGLRSLQ